MDKEAVNKRMCYPTVEHVLEHTKNAIKKIDAKHLFIATDRDTYKDDFKKDLKQLKVCVPIQWVNFANEWICQHYRCMWIHF